PISTLSRASATAQALVATTSRRMGWADSSASSPATFSGVLWPCCSSSSRLSRCRQAQTASRVRSMSWQGTPARVQRAASSSPRLPAPRLCSVADKRGNPVFGVQVGGPGLFQTGLDALQQLVGIDARNIFAQGAQSHAGAQGQVALAGLERLEVQAVMQAAEAVGLAFVGVAAHRADAEGAGTDPGYHIHGPDQLLQASGRAAE